MIHLQPRVQTLDRGTFAAGCTGGDVMRSGLPRRGETHTRTYRQHIEKTITKYPEGSHRIEQQIRKFAEAVKGIQDTQKTLEQKLGNDLGTKIPDLAWLVEYKDVLHNLSLCETKSIYTVSLAGKKTMESKDSLYRRTCRV